jgi:hypothetical protein
MFKLSSIILCFIFSFITSAGDSIKDDGEFVEIELICPALGIYKPNQNQFNTGINHFNQAQKNQEFRRQQIEVGKSRTQFVYLEGYSKKLSPYPGDMLIKLSNEYQYYKALHCNSHFITQSDQNSDISYHQDDVLSTKVIFKHVFVEDTLCKLGGTKVIPKLGTTQYAICKVKDGISISF